jgi:hypothetical protein
MAQTNKQRVDGVFTSLTRNGTNAMLVLRDAILQMAGENHDQDMLARFCQKAKESGNANIVKVTRLAWQSYFGDSVKLVVDKDHYTGFRFKTADGSKWPQGRTILPKNSWANMLDAIENKMSILSKATADKIDPSIKDEKDFDITAWAKRQAKVGHDNSVPLSVLIGQLTTAYNGKAAKVAETGFVLADPKPAASEDDLLEQKAA